MTTDSIYKILTPVEWQNFQQSGRFIGTAFDQKDGFIHACFEHQIEFILNRFFSGQEPVVLKLNPSKFPASATLKVEAATSGEHYPHIYGELNLDAVALQA
jgi:uncharacterized protein (DUF952 family)